MAVFPLHDISDTIDRYPHIKSLMKEYRIRFPGTYQILHLLANEHYPASEHLLKIIDAQIHLYGDCSFFRMIFRENDYFRFKDHLENIRLLDKLLNRFRKVIVADNLPGNQTRPDFIIPHNDVKLHIELYSPTDFYSFQFFSDYFRIELRYYPVDYGFDVSIEYENQRNGLLPDFYYKYQFDDIFEGETILKREVSNFLDRVFQKKPDAHNNYHEWGLGTETRPLTLQLKFNGYVDNKENRRIVISPPTASSDTILFFENIKTLRRSRWYPLIRNKMQKRQAGDKARNKVRILFINFSQCDMGWKEDILTPRFHNSFEEIVREINTSCDSYDVVQAVNIPLDIWGIPICFNLPDSYEHPFPATEIDPTR